MKMSKHFPNSGLFQKKNHQNSTENVRLCGFLKDSGFVARGPLVCKSLEPYLERYRLAPFLYYIPAQTPPWAAWPSHPLLLLLPLPRRGRRKGPSHPPFRQRPVSSRKRYIRTNCVHRCLFLPLSSLSPSVLEDEEMSPTAPAARSISAYSPWREEKKTFEKSFEIDCSKSKNCFDKTKKVNGSFSKLLYRVTGNECDF